MTWWHWLSFLAPAAISVIAGIVTNWLVRRRAVRNAELQREHVNAEADAWYRHAAHDASPEEWAARQPQDATD